MEPIDRREIINDMTYAISLNRHATWAHFKIDMGITKIVKDWSLITGRGWGLLQNRRGGGHVKFYPYEKGGRKKF